MLKQIIPQNFIGAFESLFFPDPLGGPSPPKSASTGRGVSTVTVLCRGRDKRFRRDAHRAAQHTGRFSGRHSDRYSGMYIGGSIPRGSAFPVGGGLRPQDNPAGELSQGVVMRFSTNGTAGGTAGGTGGMHNGRYSGKHSGRSIPRLTDLVGRHFPGKKKTS